MAKTPGDIPRNGEEENWYDVDGRRIGAHPANNGNVSSAKCNICLRYLIC